MNNSSLVSKIVAPQLVENIDQEIQSILAMIRQQLDMDVAFISEFKQDTRILRYLDFKGDEQLAQPGDTEPLNQTYCKKIVDGALPELIPDTARNEITALMESTRRYAIGAYIGVPVYVADGQVFGTFCSFSFAADATLTERDVSLLRICADIVGRYISRQLDQKKHYNETRSRVESVLDLQCIRSVYQPIYDLALDRISGFEALTRFDTDPYHSPDVWFNEAHEVGLGAQLELMAIRRALQALENLPAGIYVSLNTSPEQIVSGEIATVLTTIDASRVVLEITEHAPIPDYDAFRDALKPLREKGVRLAIDDAGAGYASFQHILELNADIIKLDISLIRNIHLDHAREALAAALIAFSKVTQCTIIAEGVEIEEELRTLKKLGVDRVQGYFIGKPQSIEDACALCSMILSSDTRRKTQN